MLPPIPKRGAKLFIHSSRFTLYDSLFSIDNLSLTFIAAVMILTLTL